MYSVSYDAFSATPTLSTMFSRGVQTLPDKFDPLDADNRKLFEDFITTFGTHVIHSVEMGGRADQTYTVSASSYQTMVSQEIDVTAQGKIGFLIR